nr:uncharacterized protein LOC102458380 [Pelodiscus sinensis]|eukprot:XP_025042023.1 uncharacterized protein LOC102458380 [Pelodiscus sinensis]
MVTCFLASTTACNKGSSVSPCQNPLAPVPTSSPLQPDLVVSQNNTGSILTPNHHVLNYMEKRHTGLHAVQEEPHTRSLQADSAAPTDQLRLPEATWNDLSLFSALFAFTLDGRASLDYKPGAAEDRHGINLSTLKLDTSLALGAQAKITGSPKLSPKGLQASSKGDLRLPSLQASKVAIEAMDSNAEVVPANLSELMVLGTDTSTMHYDPLHSTPKASAQPLRASPDAVSLARLSPSSGTKQPAAADSLTMLEMTTPESSSEQGLLGVPHSPVTRSRSQSDAVVSDISQLTDAITNAPLLAATGIGLYEAIHPYEPLKIDVETASTSPGRTHPPATAAATAKWVATIEKGHTSKLEFKASKPSFSPKPKSGPASRPKSPVHILPLQFRLLGAAYTELLKNKSSDVYKKLEKEVKLTLNKMFSNYKNFLQVNILQFLNGSVIVESEALFQEDGPAPTNSDLIRTVVTEVERKMDTFYDWRVDVTSVRSNGFSLENLEPEKLLVSFTALRLGSIAAFGGVRSQGPLDQLNDVPKKTPTALEHTQRPVPAASARAAPSEWKPTSAMLGKHKVKEVSTKAANISGVTPPALGRTSISTAASKATPVKTRTAASLPLPPAQRTTAQLTNLPLTSGPKAPVFQPLAEAKPSGVTSLHTAARILPTAKRTALLTSARTPATPCLQLPILPKPTQLMPWNRSNAPTPLRLPTSVLSTRLLLSSRHGSTAKTGLHVLTRTIGSALQPATAAATAKRVATIEKGHTSKLESKASKPSFSPKPKSGPASRPKSPVHILPLQFRLLGAAYTELLKNKSSDVYKKLEKEVKLTLNKMFSNYKNFLQVNILQFLNGSVIVESEALFQEDGPAPTNSDLIRTVVTEVERKMDTFYDWRVDVTSVRSNGFSLENLEPEKLLVSFTALRLGSIAAFGGVRSQGPLDQLNDVVVRSLGTLYKVKKFSIVRLRDIKGDLEISGEAYVDTQAHADVSQILQALRALVNYSVDLTTLSVADARLNLKVFPISFLINNWMVDEKLLDHSSVEHQSVTRSLADVLTHTLRKYQSLLQVVIRDLLSGSLSCHGDVVFQHPAPSSADVLQTLLLSVGPDDMLAGSGFQVDPYSFHVAGKTIGGSRCSTGVLQNWSGPPLQSRYNGKV